MYGITKNNSNSNNNNNMISLKNRIGISINEWVNFYKSRNATLQDSYNAVMSWCNKCFTFK